jgi:NADH:ubiquinone oxidoreductase subunit 2 (subunit N)
MSSALVWIGLPLFVSLVVWFLRNRVWPAALVGGISSLLLALLAWRLPLDSTISIIRWNFQIASAFEIFGRRFVLDAGDRNFLVMVYLTGALWLFGSALAGVKRSFAPLTLAAMALAVAALAVQPFLYAALLIELAVLISIPVLVPPGESIGQGGVRYLIFQTLAVPFILFAGWAANSMEPNTSEQRLLLLTTAFLAFGFAFWLAAFPFYSWAPLLAGEAHPYTVGFLFLLLSNTSLLLLLGFLDGFNWLRNYPLVPVTMQIIGLIMVGTAGVWSAFQNNLRKLLGYAIIVENGFALLALSLNSHIGYQIFVVQFGPRFLGIGLLAFALAILLRHGVSTELDSVRGLIRRKPFVSIALVTAYLSLSGVPLLAGFTVRQPLFINLAAQSGLGVTWAIVGNVGFLLGGLRLLVTLVDSKETTWKIEEQWPQAMLLSLGTLLIILMGVAPALFESGLLDLLQAFEHIK